jgi:cullin 1
MEGMLNDLNIGVDHQAEFKEHYDDKMESGTPTRMEFTVQVLTTGYWPSYPSFDAIMPPQMRLVSNTRFLPWTFSITSL